MVYKLRANLFGLKTEQGGNSASEDDVTTGVSRLAGLGKRRSAGHVNGLRFFQISNSQRDLWTADDGQDWETGGLSPWEPNLSP